MYSVGLQLVEFERVISEVNVPIDVPIEARAYELMSYELSVR